MNDRGRAIGKDDRGWHFAGPYRGSSHFSTLSEAKNAADDDSDHPDRPLLENKSERNHSETGRAYYIHLLVGWALFLFFPVKPLVPFLLYCHLLMVRTITSVLQPESKRSLMLWIGFTGVHIVVIAGIVAVTYYVTRVPVGTLATYDVSAQAR